MIRHVTILFLLTFTSLVIRGQSNYILFNKNSDVITLDNQARLDSLIAEIKKGDGTEAIGLSGHTDSDASEAYNKNLSLRRALAVRDYLIDAGLKNQIHIDSKGESQPLNSNATEIEKAKNRRVEVLRNYSKNNLVFDSFDREFQVYTINSEKDTLLKCKYGTNIKIDKNIFQTDVTSPITIKVQEYYSKKDFVLSNLTTQDLNNNQLETRGMINIEAIQGDKKLELKPGQSIGILFKDRKINDSTETFNGITHDAEIVWDNSLSSTITTSAVYGNSRTVFGGNIIEASKWRYQVINGVNCKITETTKDGKTIMDTASVLSETLTSNLVLNSKKLGWINCDRFYNDNSPRIDVIVKYTGTFAPNVVLVFEDINSVLPYSYREDNKLVFKNIPSDKNIVFVGLYKSKDNDKILFAQKRTKSKDGLVESITFEELSATEVQQKMIAL